MEKRRFERRLKKEREERGRRGESHIDAERRRKKERDRGGGERRG